MKGSVWLSMAVLWAGYAALFTGYAWIRGYDLSVRQIVSPFNFYQGTWPPSSASATVVIPTGSGGTATNANKA